MCCLHGCSRFALEAELESGSKEEERLEEGDRGGHGQKKKNGPKRHRRRVCGTTCSET